MKARHSDVQSSLATAGMGLVGWPVERELHAADHFSSYALFNPPQRRLLQLLQITVLIGFHQRKAKGNIVFPRFCRAKVGRETRYDVEKGQRVYRKLKCMPAFSVGFIMVIMNLTIYRKCVLIFNGPIENFGSH